MGKTVLRSFQGLFEKRPKKGTWKDIEYFDEQWKERIKKMSVFIDPEECILDVGCGKMWLKEFITDSNKYIPADYKKRGDECIVVDLNQNQFPEIHVDVIFASGVLEYVNNPEWFVKNVSLYSNKCIISYCTTNYFPDINSRISLKWVNHLSSDTLISLFEKYKLILEKSTFTNSNNSIFVFKKQ